VRRRRLIRLQPEVLEERALLSTFTVTDNTDNPADTGSLRYAINNAPSGSIVQFASSVGNSITLMNGVLNIKTDLNIEGPGSDTLTINGGGASAIFSVAGSTTATIAGLTLSNGSSAGAGGAILNSGTLTLNSCTVSLSTAATTGGGIENDGFMQATNCTIADDSAGMSGGGIYNSDSATLTLTSCTIGGDSAANGGGIYNTGTLQASGTTIAGNHALIAAGAITGDGSGVNNAGLLTLTNCTVANNSTIGTGVSPRGAGGGINNTSAGSMTLINSTIADNVAAGNGGGINNGGLAALANTIVATNTASGSGPDVFGTVTANSAYNLIGNGAGLSGIGNGTNGNQVGFAGTPIDPLLAPLGNYGGPNQTMALLPGSPAIDAGSDVLASNSSLTADERGFPRIANGTVDIGAFEVQVFMAYSTMPSGGGSLYTAITNANQAGGSVIVVTATGLIGLTSSLPSISQNVQILGPGANNLAVSGNGQFQVFNIQSGAMVWISGLTINNGLSGTSGGAIGNAGTLFLSNSIVSNSTATSSGGGISNSSNGTLTATNCTIANNSAAIGGGIQNAGTLSLINCTIAGNSALGAGTGNGGGIANTGTLTASDCTIAANSAAAAGGGIYNSSGASAALANTIVAANKPSGSDIAGAGTLTNEQGSSLIGGNPVLGGLENNGGPTPTMAVLPGSPAIAAGNVSLIPAGITTDQRGIARTFNSAVDIGAFQSRGFTIAMVSGNNQHTTLGTAFSLPLVVAVTSPFGDPVQGGVVSYVVMPSVSGAGLTVPSATAAINSAGLSALTATANTVTGSYTVAASANGATPSSVSFNLTNLVVAPTKLVIVTQPPSSVIAGQPFQAVVYEEDQYGNLATQDNSTIVTASLHNSTTSLQSVMVVGGVATFTALRYTKAGSITLDFTGGALTPATSNPIAIKAAAANRFILHIPNNGVFKTNTPYTLVILALDVYGNQARGYLGTIQITSSRPATLPGNGIYTFVASDNGVHTFSNSLAFGQVGTVTITVFDISNHSIAGSVTVGVSDPPAKMTKPASRRLVRRAHAASAKAQIPRAVELRGGNPSKTPQTMGAGSVHQAAVVTHDTPAAGRADAVRESILSELRGSLRAYLAIEKFTILS